MKQQKESAAAHGATLACGAGSPAGSDAPRLKKPRRGAFVAKSCGYAVVGMLVLALLSGGLLVARLTRGPMSIDGLGPLIADALDQRFGRGYDFTLGQTSMVKHGVSPTLSIDGLSLKDGSGRTIFKAPRAEVSIDLLSLIAGRVVPKRLEVFDVEVRLALLPDGSIAQPIAPGSDETVAITPPLAESLVKAGASPAEVGVAASSQPADQNGSPPAAAGTQPKPRALLVRQMSSALRLLMDALTSPDSQIAAVDRIAISRGRVVIDDRTTHQKVTFDGVNLGFQRNSGSTTFNLAVDGPNGRWSATGLASGAPGAQRSLMLQLQNLSIDEILLATGARSIGADFDMPLSASFSVGLRPDGVLSEAVASFGMGAGYLRFDDPNDEPMMVDSIQGGAHWDGATRRIIIDPVKLTAGETHGAVSGSVALPVQEGDPWLINIVQAEPIIAAPERPGQKTVIVDYLAMTARLLLGEKRLVFDRILLGGPQAGFSMAGDVDWTNGPRLRFGAALDPTPISVVTRLWPSFICAPVRNYLLDHVKAGAVEKATLQIDFNAADLDAMRDEHPPPDESLLLDFTVANGSVEFLSGVPPLTGVDGVGRITGRTSTFTTTSVGMLDAGEGRTLTTAAGGTFHIADANQKPTPAVIVAKVSSTVDTIGDLLARDALKPYANLPLAASTLRGQVDGRLEIDLNLGPNMSPADTSLKINSVVTNFTAENLLGKEALEAATLAINVDASGLKASGQGRMFGAPATVEMNQPSGKAASAMVHIIMDDAARAKQGLGGVPGVTGPIAATITAPLGTGENIRADVELDLTHAGIEWPGASKPPGRPGKAKFLLAVNNGLTSLDQIVLDAGAVQAHGQIELGPDQSLQSAKFGQVKFSPGDDMKVDALRVGETLKVMVRAGTIDARPFLKTLFASSSDTPAPSAAASLPPGVSPSPIKEIDLDVKSALLSGYNKQVLTGLELRMLKRDELYKQLSFAGRFGRQTVSGNLTGPPAASQLTILSDDAGSLLLFTDLYKHMERGRLSATMQIGGGLSGVLTIDSFVLRDEPALRRLVAEGVPPPDATGRVPKIDAGAMAFNRLQVRYDRAGTRLLLRDGVMNGDAIGLTVDGWLDFAHDGVDMKGTFVPAYAVNNLFSKIPVVGLILGGGSNEGLIGVNYRVEGKISAPTLSINPLSAIAPGIFRQIFGVGAHIPSAGAAGQ
ncbi:DUF3971 domain-containing protein [Methylocella tundrae]|uniref:YhdP family protein n=1 Tax=Methylocella tundrae TaxID=227605 RepID=UPI00157AD626|nr:DUF3971 domain-containing protein [Methylocella tundrae]